MEHHLLPGGSDRPQEQHRRRGLTWHALHLLWAVPVAWAIGYPLWLLQRGQWCGYGGCWAQNVDWHLTGSAAGITISVIGGLFIVAAFVIPPWLWPWWARLIIALPLAALDIYYFGWGNAPSGIPFIPTLGNEFF